MDSDSRFANWRKSTRSDGGQDCVEVSDGMRVVGVRDSKDQAGPILTFDRGAWAAFVANISATG